MKLRILMAAVAVAGPLSASPASADECHLQTVTVMVQGAIQTSTHLVCAGSSASEPAVALPSQDQLDNACAATIAVLNLPMVPFCLGEEPEAPAITPVLVAAALKRIPLPPSKLIVQPPNGRTLVNFDTNFYTETEAFTRSVTLLGQQVELSITPASFAWRFGDGKSETTTSPGSAYPDLEITHNYLRKGRVTPSVDTTYTATYRVNGGAAQPVPGSVTIAGTAVPLRVVTARPQLVG